MQPLGAAIFNCIDCIDGCFWVSCMLSMYETVVNVYLPAFSHGIVWVNKANMINMQYLRPW